MLAGKPIVAFVPEKSELADMIRRTRTGVVLPSDDHEVAVERFTTLLKTLQGGTLESDPDPEALRQYRWEETVDRMEGILRGLWP